MNGILIVSNRSNICTMLRNYLLIAWRNLQRNKIFTAINVLGLATGMAACILILQYVGFEMSFDQFVPHKAEIYRIVGEDTNRQTRLAVTLPIVAPGMQEAIPEVVAATRILPRDGTVSYVREGEILAFREEDYSYADAQFLEVFSWPVSPPEALEIPFSILLSESTARKYFGEEAAIGRVLTLHDDFGQVDYTVRGTYPDLPANSHLQPELLVSYHHLEGPIWEQYNLNGWNAFFSYVRLQPEANMEQVAAKFPELIAQAVGEDSGYDMDLQSLEDIHLHSGEYGYDRAVTGDLQRVYFLLLLAMFILVLAWVNYVNLATSRSLDRAKEVGIRKLLGSHRSQLIRQFLFESLLLNAIAAVIALTMVQVFAPWVYEITGIQGVPEGWLLVSPKYATMLVVFFTLGAFLAGIYPAWMLSGFEASDVLAGSFGRSQKGIRLRKALVVLQFTVAALLITGTFAVYQQLSFMKNQDLGLDIRQKLAIEGPTVTDSTYIQRMQTLQNELSAIPQVESVLATGMLPGANFNYGTGIRLPGQAETDGKSCEIAYVQTDFFAHFNMPILYGRGFAPQRDSDRGRVIVSESVLVMYNLPVSEASIGQKVILGNSVDPATIIGIVPNYHHGSLRNGFDPIVYNHEENISYLSLQLQTSGVDLPVLLKTIEARFLEIFPGNPYQSLFLDEVFDRHYEEDQRFGRAFGLFAGLTILVAMMGLLGLAATSAVQRTKEVGIRKVMGASVPDIILLLSREFLSLVLIAALLAMIPAFLGIRWWLEQYAFRMDVSIGLFLVPLMLVLAVAALTVAGQTFRIARANPVDALRHE